MIIIGRCAKKCCLDFDLSKRRSLLTDWIYDILVYASVPSFSVSLWDLMPNLSSAFLADKSER